MVEGERKKERKREEEEEKEKEAAKIGHVADVGYLRGGDRRERL